jgi:hypothetical protein
MKQPEALELLKEGVNIYSNDYNSNVFWKLYGNDTIMMLNQETNCAASIISTFTEEEFLKTGDIDFITP